MNEEVKTEKFRLLSIMALVTGIIAIVDLGVIFLLSALDVMGVLNFDIFSLSLSILFWIIGLAPIAAIVCGAIDLSNIRAGRVSRKGKGMDIAGIVLGASNFMLGIIGLIVFIFMGFAFAYG
jgi:hypothetical protein